ncbi:hypothetical protein HK102_000273 [Quaeritorhiza haematococci]|nr:hypothetical protein HK102_000273 [Quaeritorhiza haematococci]
MKPKTIPLPEEGADYIMRDFLSPYIHIFKRRNDTAYDSIQHWTPLDRMKLRLFRLFFFDVLEALPSFSKHYELEKLKAKANYVVQSLLHLSQNADDPLGPQAKGSNHSEQPDRLRNDVVCLDEIANSAPTNEQQQLIVSPQLNTTTQTCPQRHFCSAGPPTLPPELVTCVLQHLVALRASPHELTDTFHTRRLAALARCALVNRTWHSVTLPLIWKYVRLDSTFSGFRFLRWILSSSSCVPEGAPQLVDWPGTWVVRVKLFCKDRQSMSIWRTLAQNLFLFPKLRRLTLAGLPRTEELSVLFEQDLPSLKRLAIHDFIPSGRHVPRKRTGLWDYGLLIDQERVRSFFSRLTSVKWKQMDDEDVDYPALLDTAHENLHQIAFPDQMPDLVARRFFDSCSHFNSLSVVRLLQGELTQWTFEVFATKCPSLRALSVHYNEEIDPAGFEYLMELRGPELVALELVDFSDYRIEDLNPNRNLQLMRAITKHCQSLEYLNMDMIAVRETPGAFEDGLLDLLRKRGRQLHYLYLGIYDHSEINTDNAIATAMLVQTLGDSCPNLRGLEWASDIVFMPLEGSENLFAKLLEKCGHLQTLDLQFPLLLQESGITDPHLKAKLQSLQGKIGKKGYFCSESYCSQSLQNFPVLKSQLQFP